MLRVHMLITMIIVKPMLNYSPPHSPYNNDLDQFLDLWDQEYNLCMSKIDLFNSTLTAQLSIEQRQFFAKAFYHARGHFHSFLWFVGNHTDNKSMKDLILHNIAEELNGGAISHEQMYFEFAKSLGVDIGEEFITEENYLPFLKDFNKGHIKWLYKNSNYARTSALAAYERLDNIDYVSLLSLAESLDVEKKGLIFFKVHVKVKHFETIEDQIREIWKLDQDQVKGAFKFIAGHQLKMWRQLSDAVFAHN
jgi:hypothetical protein